MQYPSVYAYFNTLPDKIQECEGVIDGARVLEKRGHYYTPLERQEVLNYISTYELPKSEGNFRFLYL